MSHFHESACIPGKQTQVKIGRLSIVLIAVFFSLLVAVVFCLIPASNRGQTAFYKPLISPKNASAIRIVEITQTSDQYPIILEKKDGRWWLCLDDTHRYPAQSNRIESLLGTLSARQPVHTTGSSDRQLHGIGGKDSYSLRLMNDRSTPVLNLVFGNTSADGTDIFFCNDPANSNAAVLRTRNSYSSYLDTRTAFWADLGLFHGLTANSEIQRIEYNGYGFVKNYIAGEGSEITAFSGFLDSLQCIDITNIPLAPEETLMLEFGDTTTLRLGLARLDDTTSILINMNSGNPYIISASAHKELRKALGLK